MTRLIGFDWMNEQRVQNGISMLDFEMCEKLVHQFQIEYARTKQTFERVQVSQVLFAKMLIQIVFRVELSRAQIALERVIELR
jgi:hypothetical protein